MTPVSLVCVAHFVHVYPLSEANLPVTNPVDTLCRRTSLRRCIATMKMDTSLIVPCVVVAQRSSYVKMSAAAGKQLMRSLTVLGRIASLPLGIVSRASLRV